MKKSVLIGIVAAVVIVLLILVATGAAEEIIKGILALLGVGASLKGAQVITKARKTITDSTETNEEVTEELNNRQEERAEKDEAAVEEANADPGPITDAPDDEDEREKLRREMEGEAWGRDS